jgi:hypothetical protein
VLADQFTDAAVSITGTVVAALLLAGLFALVRFLWHVRDSLRDITKSVKDGRDEQTERAGDEPVLYDLVMTGVENSVEGVRQAKIIKGTLAQHLKDDDERFASVQAATDRKIDELRDVVIDLRDNVEGLAVTVEAMNSE